MKSKEQLEILGIRYFCELVREDKIDLQRADLKRADLQGAYLWRSNLKRADLWWSNLQEADLQGAHLQGANLQEADLRGANLWWSNLQEADLRGADIDFSCWPLWCGSANVIIDERQAKQIMSHAFNAARNFCEPTEEQKQFCNDFHRIITNEFPKIG